MRSTSFLSVHFLGYTDFVSTRHCLCINLIASASASHCLCISGGHKYGGSSQCTHPPRNSLNNSITELKLNCASPCLMRRGRTILIGSRGKPGRNSGNLAVTAQLAVTAHLEAQHTWQSQHTWHPQYSWHPQHTWQSQYTCYDLLHHSLQARSAESVVSCS